MIQITAIYAKYVKTGIFTCKKDNGYSFQNPYLCHENPLPYETSPPRRPAAPADRRTRPARTEQQPQPAAECRSRLAGDRFEGRINYTLNHFGRQAVDANIATPVGGGWGVSVGTWQNFDPGSNHLVMSYLQERTQFYKAALSKMEFEFEPSYSVDRWRFWLSARYFSRQYINKTNSLYFNPRWETFGGVDYRLNDRIGFALSLVNLLNQKGANGSITSADLVTDASRYRNYVMAGTFIRPFTVELTTRISF